MKKNQKGSALLWSIIVVFVLTILVAGSMMIATSYYKRTLLTNDKRQAYLTAKGVIEDVVENIEASNIEYLKIFSDPSKTTFTPLVAEGNEIPLNIYLKASDKIGTIKSTSSIRINKISEDPMNPKGTITIKIVSSYNNAEYMVKADMRLGFKDGIDRWQLQKYYQIDTELETSNNITIGSKLENEMNYYLKYYNLKKDELGKQEKAMQALIEYMKQDKSWSNVEDSLKARLEKMTYFNDFNIREYFASRNEDHKFTLFNTNEVKGKDIITVPVAVGDRIEKKEVSLVGKNFFKGTYFIQPKYANNYNVSFVFAYTGNVVNGTPTGQPFNGGSINLVYHDNHWYYIDKIRLSDTDTPRDLTPTTFDTTDPDTKLNYLIDNFLTEGNRIQ